MGHFAYFSTTIRERNLQLAATNLAIFLLSSFLPPSSLSQILIQYPHDEGGCYELAGKNYR